MNDLIDRQAAIEAVIAYNLEEEGDTVALMMILKGLPSAEPERQIELDGTESTIEILSELRAQFNCFEEYEEPVYHALSEAIKALSAEPDQWIREVRIQYERFNAMSWVKKPLAKALYEVWKKHDIEDTERIQVLKENG